MKTAFKSIIVCLLLFAGYSVLLPRLPGYVKAGGRAGSQWEVNLMRAQEFYDSAKTPTVTLAGSSISQHLTGLPDDWFNLSLAGGSGFTSLEIMLRSKKSPRYVLIETNVLALGADEQMVQSLTNPLSDQARRRFPVLLETNKPHHVLLRWVDSLHHDFRAVNGPKPMGADADAQTPEPQLPPDIPPELFRHVVEERLQGLAKPISQERLDEIAQRLERLVSAMQERGSTIVFYEVPELPDAMATPGKRSLHGRLTAAFPPTKYAWAPMVDAHDYRTTDGIHLTPRSGERYARVLVAYVGSLSPGSTTEGIAR